MVWVAELASVLEVAGTVVVPLLAEVLLVAVFADVPLAVVVVVVSAAVVPVAVSATADVEEEVEPESLPPQPANAIVTLPNNAGQATRPVRVTFFMRPRKR